ncbi:hypothetical protein MMC18_008256 [Xylographa bjoerkii]|nr:hypothetical protein [Xylographa bjoerkii]
MDPHVINSIENSAMEFEATSSEATSSKAASSGATSSDLSGAEAVKSEAMDSEAMYSEATSVDSEDVGPPDEIPGGMPPGAVATMARGDPALNMLQIIIFAKSEINSILNPQFVDDFLSTETGGMVHMCFLSPLVLRISHIYRPDGEKPWVLRHDPEVVEVEEDYDLEITLHVHNSMLNFQGHLPLKLAVFDLDSTLIEQEVIDELARSIGVQDAVSDITRRAMAGELDFAQSLKARVALLRGVNSMSVWNELKKIIKFAEGARELCRALKRLGVKMAVISGGFIQIAEWVKEELGLDYAYANHLEESLPQPHYPHMFLTGNLEPSYPIITAEAKEELLAQIAGANRVLLSEILCVGDGANDLRMLELVGLGGGFAVAFKAKEHVQKVVSLSDTTMPNVAAPNRLNSNSLIDLLHLMLYDSDEIRELTKPWGEHVTMPSNEVKYDVVDLLQDMVAERDTTPLQYLKEIEDEEEAIEAMEDIEDVEDEEDIEDEEAVEDEEDVEDEEGPDDEMDTVEVKVEKEPTPFPSIE